MNVQVPQVADKILRVPIYPGATKSELIKGLIAKGDYDRIFVELVKPSQRAAVFDICQELAVILAEFGIRKYNPIVVSLINTPSDDWPGLMEYFGDRGISVVTHE